MKRQARDRFDIIVIGAGVIGASVAYHLCKLGASNLLVVEREEFPGSGSTSRANGGIRAQFTTEMNVNMSLLSMALLDQLDADERQQAGYTKAGYLFMTADSGRMRHLEGNVRFQDALGAAVDLLTPEDLAERVPFVKTDDLVGGTFGGRDGFIEPNGLTQAFLSGAQKLGAQFLNQTTVTDLLRRGNRVSGVQTNAGEFLADLVVNCAGPQASIVADMAGVDLPVQPIRRQIAVTGPIATIPPRIPMTVDADTGLLIRRHGEAVAMAYSNPDEPAGLNVKFDPDFIEVIAPKLTARFPILEPAGIDFSRCRAGCYEVTPDHHAIIGESGVPGFMLCNGFSGHGIMHAPAAGLLLAEMITKGRTESLDVTPLALRRFADGKLLHEGAVL